MRVFRVNLKDYYPFLGEDGRNPTVDVYLPYNLKQLNRQDDKRPTIVVCPGGAYAFCSETEAEPIALKFLEDGYNVFVITYSTDPHRYPVQITEVAALFDYIYKNADEFNCDTGKIGIIGFSAGGHLAAHYSNLWHIDYLKNIFGNVYKPAASMLCYPVISTVNAHKGSFKNLIGHFPETEEEIDLFSCERLVGPHTPPTFLFHTAPDTCVPVQNSIFYAKALADNHIPFEMHIYPFGAHGISTADKLSLDLVDDKTKYTSDWIKKVKNWLKVTFDD